MHLPHHRHSEQRLQRIDRVPAQHQAARPLHDLARAAHDVGEQLEGELLPGPADQVEREERGTAHGVHVTQRVGGGDRAPGGGIVHDRREEVHRRHQGAVVREAKDRRIVPGRGVHEHPRVARARQQAQHLGQLAGAELAGATRAMGERGQPDAGCLIDRLLGHESVPVSMGTVVLRARRPGAEGSLISELRRDTGTGTRLL